MRNSSVQKCAECTYCVKIYKISKISTSVIIVGKQNVISAQVPFHQCFTIWIYINVRSLITKIIHLTFNLIKFPHKSCHPSWWITRKEISLFPEEQRKRISKRRKTIGEKLMVILAPCHFTTRKSCSFSTFFSFSSFGWLFHWRIVGRWQVKPSCARKVMQEEIGSDPFDRI